MQYVYAAMVLHEAGHKIDEAGVTKVVEAGGAKADPGMVKAVVSALQGVDIAQVMTQALSMPAAAPAHAEAKSAEPKKEEKKVDDRKTEEAAAAGLGALFG